jgi:hypothetical protein
LRKRNGAKLATPKKRSTLPIVRRPLALFTALPEIALPRGFRRGELKRWVERIRSERSRTITRRKLDAFLATAAE